MSQSRPWRRRTFVLCPGAGSGPEYWYRLTPLLEQAGHAWCRSALPNGPGATLADQADAIVAAAGAAEHVVLVAQSMAGFSAPLACDRLPVDWLVLVNAMIPAPGETAGDVVGQHRPGGGGPGQRRARTAATPTRRSTCHTTSCTTCRRRSSSWCWQTEAGEPADSLFAVPFDRPGWPDVPTTVLAGREDRLFPFDFQVRVARERSGSRSKPLPGGHLVALSQPGPRLAERLLGRPGSRAGQAPTGS